MKPLAELPDVLPPTPGSRPLPPRSVRTTRAPWREPDPEPATSPTNSSTPGSPPPPAAPTGAA